MREDLSTIVSAIPLPTVIIGVDERIVNANEAARELFGKTIEGRNLLTAFRHPQILAAIETCQRQGQPTEAQFNVTTGEITITFLGHIQNIHIDDFEGIIVCCEDVSHVMEARQIRRDFVANVSHELRTPLTAMLGFIETIRGPAKNDEKARDRFLGTLEAETKRMTRLVQDLLSLSRLEGEERIKPDEEIDLVTVLNSSIERLEVLAERQNVILKLICPERGIKLRGSPDQLGQVVTNLIENAIKYGGNDKTVTILAGVVEQGVGVRSKSVQISVKDQGPGIAASQIPRLTERFYRVDSHRSRELGGTGLGLAIVKHIVNRHRGTLRITSKPGEGSCFAVTLPIL